MPYKDPIKEKASSKVRASRWWSRNRIKLRSKRAEYSRHYNRKKNTGWTKEDYAKAQNKQQGFCAICGMHESLQGRSLAADHCHKTGKKRGLLCMNCNNGLGRFKDNPLLLRKAATYLENDILGAEESLSHACEPCISV